MTTPHERRRNLIWGREALEEQSADATLPQEWRDKSAELLSGYPSLASIRDSSDHGLEPLQIQHATVLAAIRDLFQRMRVSRAITEQRRYSLLVILRHFY
ncbi:BPSL0761 family protein [Roseateles sp.]|uniref:BPSL0761 family protein n=1 Tax=Roseateles sp. TaxID=1971397 RepID=UPI003BAD8C8C